MGCQVGRPPRPPGHDWPVWLALTDANACRRGPDLVGREHAPSTQGGGRHVGYTRYVAQGGDVGAVVTDAMGRQAPEGLVGIHTNLLVTALFLREAINRTALGIPPAMTGTPGSAPT